jgi:diaminopimelate decarboxylase
MIEGARRVVDLALEIRAQRGAPIDLFDLGGGLPVDYAGGAAAPGVSEYVAALKQRVPELFAGAGTSGPTLLATEFGRSLSATIGWVASRVEYTKTSGEHRIAVIHAGADLFVRAAYLPEVWSHRVTVHDASGAPKEGPLEPWDVAGPLCFSGDLIARGRALPPIAPGDITIVHDAGAYTLSMWSRYNSRRAPQVIGYEGDPPEISLLKPTESIEDLLRFWG